MRYKKRLAPYGALAALLILLVSCASKDQEGFDRTLEVDIDHLPTVMIRPDWYVSGTPRGGRARFYRVDDLETNDRCQILVADRARPGVAILDPSGKLIKATGSEGGGPKEFGKRLELAAAESLLYVLDYENSRVQLLDYQLRFVASSPFTSGLSGFAYLPAAKALVAVGVTPWNHDVVQLFSASVPFKLIGSFRKREPSRGGLSHLVLNTGRASASANGRVAFCFIWNPEVEIYDAQGRPLCKVVFSGKRASRVRRNLGTTLGGRIPAPAMPIFAEDMKLDEGGLWLLVASDVIRVPFEGQPLRFRPVGSDSVRKRFGGEMRRALYTRFALCKRYLYLCRSGVSIDVFRAESLGRGTLRETGVLAQKTIGR